MPKFLFIHVNEWATFDSPDSIPISQGFALASLTKHGFEGRILGDYKDRPLSPSLLREAIMDLKPAVAGFSVYEENINKVRVWASYLKRLDPSILVIMGGPQITFMPQSALDEMPEVDVFGRGEGEIVMPALAEVLARGGELSEVPGICFNKNGTVVQTDAVEEPKDLDTFPSPYLEDIVDVSGKSRVIMLSSRGCTSPCTFCYTTRASKGRVRFHSLDRIIAELAHLKNKGISDFWFADPNFAFSRKRLTSLLERIISEVPGITFWCQTRYNLVDQELLSLLRRAGAHTIAFGLESADRDVLGAIKKGLNTEKLSQIIVMVKQTGIEVELFSLFGLPSETFGQAVSTLEYVKANKVVIDGNSICQQLHLFYGAPITQDPAAYGVRPLAITKPDYLGICRDFKTDAMSEKEIRQMSLLWRLNRRDFAEDIRDGDNLFRVAGFITANYDLLSCRPEADLMLAKIYLALEEFDRALECMDRLVANFPETPEVREFISVPFVGYKMKRRATAGPGCKVIYDCKGMIGGKVVPATEAFYQEAVIGDGRLLAGFEKGLEGLRAGRIGQCDVLFPDDYGNRELAGRQAVFHIYLHQVLEPVAIKSREALRERPPANIYRFHDLAGLRKWNEKLYYLVMKDAMVRDFQHEMTEFLSLLNLYLKLGFKERAEAMLEILPSDKGVLGHAGRVLLANEYNEKAYEILTAAGGGDNEVIISRAKALIKMKRYEEAEELVADPALSGNIQALDMRVGLASLRQYHKDIYLERMSALIDLQISNMEKL